MMDYITIICGVIAAFLILFYLTSNRNFFSKKGIPGPRPWPLFGNIADVFREGSVYDEKIYAKYGKLVGTFMGPVPSLVVFDQDLLKEIMITNSASFQDHYVPFERKPPLDKILTQLVGDDWKRVRTAVTPIFTSGKLKKMTPMIFHSVEALSAKFLAFAETGEEVKMKDLFARYTITVIADTMFGMKITAMDKEDDPFYSYSKKVMEIKPKAFFMIMLMMIPSIGKILRFFNLEAFDKEAMNFLISGLDRAIQQRKGHEDEYNDFVSLLLKAEIPEEEAKGGARGLTTEEMMAQAFVFMLAGYDTTSNALTAVAYKLALHPEHQERCREEVLAEFQDDSPEQMYESLSRMHYLDHCFNEALRLYPPAMRSDRCATKDVQLGGHFFPKGTNFAIPIRMSMRDPELWENPEEFIPDRFASPDGGRARLPFSFLAFGAGPRNCVGMRLAILKAKLALADALRKVRFVASENTPTEPLNLGFRGFNALNPPLVLKMEKL